MAVVSLHDSMSFQQGAETLLKEQRVPLSAPPDGLYDLLGRYIPEESFGKLLFRPFRKRAQLNAADRQTGVGREGSIQRRDIARGIRPAGEHQEQRAFFAQGKQLLG